MPNTTSPRSEFEKDAKGQHNYWDQELCAAETTLKQFHTQGSKVVNRFLSRKTEGEEEFKLNIFHANVKTLQSMLYGNLPKIDTSRSFGDADDDIGRVAAEMIERLLTLDIEENGEEYSSVLKAALQDRLLPGVGCARVRYVAEFESYEDQEEDEEDDEEEDSNAYGEGSEDTEGKEEILPKTQTDPEPEERLVWEDAPVEYYHWRDVLWGWTRTWADLPWLAYRSYLCKDSVTERFGEKIAEGIEYKTHTVAGNKAEVTDTDLDDPLQKAEIWEIWDKIGNKVCWFCSSADRILDSQEDTLELDNFFPSPPFFMANQTTSLYVPVSDYYMAQDLYNEIDKIQTRIAAITEAVKLAGVYDKAAGAEVGRLMKEANTGDLIPVDNWAMFGEKGGLAGCIEWLPLKDIVDALENLQRVRDDTIALLYQITGMSDIMRGSLDQAREGVGQSELKAKFGSIGVQALQEEFARFAGDLLQIKAEIITKHFDDKTIVARSNIQYTKDTLYIQPALALLRDENQAKVRVTIRPESIAMIDYAKLREERTEYLTALGTFMQSASGMLAVSPNIMPYLLELLQWGLAGYKGSQNIEAVMDKAIAEANKAQQGGGGKQEDPEAAKAAAATQAIQMKHKLEMEKIQANFRQEMEKMSTAFTNKIKEIQTKAQADTQEELDTSNINAKQAATSVQMEMEKGEEAHDNSLELEDLRHENKMKEITAANAAKESADDS